MVMPHKPYCKLQNAADAAFILRKKDSRNGSGRRPKTGPASNALAAPKARDAMFEGSNHDASVPHGVTAMEPA